MYAEHLMVLKCVVNSSSPVGWGLYVHFTGEKLLARGQCPLSSLAQTPTQKLYVGGISLFLSKAQKLQPFSLIGKKIHDQHCLPGLRGQVR